MTIGEMNPFLRLSFILQWHPLQKKLVKCADSRLFYILNGTGELTIEGVTHSVSKDSLALWRAGTKYYWDFPKKEKVSIVVIDFDYTQEYSEKKNSLNLIHEKSFESRRVYETPEFEDLPILNKPIFLNNASVFKKDVLDLNDEFESRKLLSGEMSGVMLNQLILKIARYASADKRTPSKIEPILEYIRTNYSSEITNISLGKLANYHPHYINLLMKEYTGTTLHSYLTEYRMNEAKKLLLNTDDSIELVAHSTGFKNPTHFCKIFKKKFGISPSEYRKSARTI